MLRRIILTGLVFISFQTIVTAQEKKKIANAGFGAGLHYGGIGCNISVAPVKYLALEGGLGYNFVGLGINGGAAFRILPNRRVCPDIGFLYGYNAAIKVKNAQEQNKSYYGFSAAAGIKIWNKVHRQFFNLQFLIPFRSDEYEEDLSKLVVENKPPDFAISLGYHF